MRRFESFGETRQVHHGQPWIEFDDFPLDRLKHVVDRRPQTAQVAGNEIQLRRAQETTVRCDRILTPEEAGWVVLDGRKMRKHVDT